MGNSNNNNNNNNNNAIMENTNNNNNDTSTTSLIKLPNNGCCWIELMDPTSGQTYYFNEETNKSSWDMPLVEQQQDESLAISSSDLQKEGGGNVAFTNDDALMNSDTEFKDNSMIIHEEEDKDDFIAL